MQITPPRPPIRVALADDGELRHFHMRMWKLGLATITILVTAWFMMLGPIPAILALVVAKHLLVAILVMDLGVDARATREG